MVKVGYKKNEWVLVYCDENGKRRVLFADTKEKAAKLFTEYYNYQSVIGVMTTSFYNHYIEKLDVEFC